MHKHTRLHHLSQACLDLARLGWLGRPDPGSQTRPKWSVLQVALGLAKCFAV
jgi:hypothetical protein